MADSAPSRPASVVVLLDCSGSMHGSRIALARKSLLHFAALLKPEEKFHVIRFGSIFEHIGGGLRFASPFNILRLRKSLKSAYAELGATRLDEALTDAIDRVPEGERADILLVSDGNVWNADDSIQKARERGIRIFCAAIGDAPNLSLLEKLARETGGKSLAVASAKEAAAIPRILVARMRVANDRAPFERGCPRNPRLSTPAHDCEFVFGRLESPSLDACEEIVREDFETWRPSLDPDLDKIAASAALGAMSDERDRLDLALEYQILNEETALILELGKRRSGEKLPRIEYVPQMLPRDQKAHKIVVEKSFAVPPLFGALADNFVEIQREDSQPQPEIYDKPSLREFIDYWMESISVHPPLEIQEIPEKFAIIRGFLKGLLDKYDIDERSLIIAFAKWLAEKYGLAAAIPRRAGRLFFSMRIDDDSLARLVEEFNLCSLDE